MRLGVVLRKARSLWSGAGVTLVLLTVMLLVGCGAGAEQGAASAIPSTKVAADAEGESPSGILNFQAVRGPTGPAWVVYGVDVSGSFRLTSNAFAQAAKEVERHAQPGDVWFFRLINDRSYADDASILALRCPPPVADSANPFDRKSKIRKHAADVELARLREASAQFLMRYQVKAAPRTDIYGFLAKSGELLAAAPQGTRKILIIASDFVDTAGQSPAIDLTDVRVVVGLFQGSGHGKTTQTLRRSWQTKFQKFGAREVRFVDASQAMIEDLVNR